MRHIVMTKFKLCRIGSTKSLYNGSMIPFIPDNKIIPSVRHPVPLIDGEAVENTMASSLFMKLASFRSNSSEYRVYRSGSGNRHPGTIFFCCSNSRLFHFRMIGQPTICIGTEHQHFFSLMTTSVSWSLSIAEIGVDTAAFARCGASYFIIFSLKRFI